VEGSLAGVSRKPYFRYTLAVTVNSDGKIVMHLTGKVREDSFWLPRLGYTFLLPGDSNSFTYFGRGPLENYCDMCHAASVGMYESNTDAEYVNYVRPQEHGNHTSTKLLNIGKLQFRAETEFDINVSNYSIPALEKAKHTDELVADGFTHLRVDYKNSGLGSNSCGPALEAKYQLKEKDIEFRFSIQPHF